MAPHSIQGSATLAEQIRRRRNELRLTIEEAASRASVGTKTWSRYEAGESIRKDKCKGVCKALNWGCLPNQEEETEGLSIEECRKGEAWSSHLEKEFGAMAALSFAVGSNMLCDRIEGDMEELVCMPARTHIGQLSVSLLVDDLPEQFLMEYDYGFLYRMKCTLLALRGRARAGLPMTAHSVLEELLIYLCSEEAKSLIELSGGIRSTGEGEGFDGAEYWVFDLFGDMDIVTYLYSNIYLEPNHPYHYSRWVERQFYTE